MSTDMKKAAAWLREGLERIGVRTGKRVPPDELFRRFRAVLENNNRSLEIITDIGETLSGDYLFDIQYVRRSYAELSASLERSLASFDVLTARRYPRLRTVCRSIDENIRHTIDEASPQKKDLVVLAEDGDLLDILSGADADLFSVPGGIHRGLDRAETSTRPAWLDANSCCLGDRGL